MLCAPTYNPFSKTVQPLFPSCKHTVMWQEIKFCNKQIWFQEMWKWSSKVVKIGGRSGENGKTWELLWRPSDEMAGHISGSQNSNPELFWSELFLSMKKNGGQKFSIKIKQTKNWPVIIQKAKIQFLIYSHLNFFWGTFLLLLKNSNKKSCAHY